MILVAICTLSLPPHAASQLPMISSVRPMVSARIGLVGYISAESQNVTLRSMAISACRWPYARCLSYPPKIGL